MPKKNNNIFVAGFTLIEALIVIAIIAIISVYYVINLRSNITDLAKMDTTRLAADIRYVRSMATSRATHNGVYPGGYGIRFEGGTGDVNGNRQVDAGETESRYLLFASSTYNSVNILKTVTLSNFAFRLVDPNNYNDSSTKTFVFLSENEVRVDNFTVSPDGDYQIEIYHPYTSDGYDYYFKGRINIGRKTNDDFVWSNLAITYDILQSRCGNGLVEPESGEQCEPVDEDENPISGTNCRPDCRLNFCGDGFLLAGVEECELNTNDATPVLCPPPAASWCTDCYDSSGTCKNVATGQPVDCCGSYMGTCNNCVYKSSRCVEWCVQPMEP